jgi:hypothetical protein
MSLRLKLSGTAITDYTDVSEADADVVFPINRPYSPFPEGWTVTGTTPDRHLVAPDGSLRAVEEHSGAAPGESEGGSQPQTATATVTTDPDTFVVSQDFDCGRPTLVAIAFTATAFDADGETWDVTIAADVKSLEYSVDGITWLLHTYQTLAPDTPGGPGTFTFGGLMPTPRYIRIDRVRIIDPSTFDVYAGPNHPSVTVRIDLEYL